MPRPVLWPEFPETVMRLMADTDSDAEALEALRQQFNNHRNTGWEWLRNARWRDTWVAQPEAQVDDPSRQLCSWWPWFAGGPQFSLHAAIRGWVGVYQRLEADPASIVEPKQVFKNFIGKVRFTP